MKKILIAADVATHPCTGGNNQCIMQYAENLRTIGFEVYYLLIGTNGLRDEWIEDTLKYWGNYGFYYPLPSWQSLYQRIYRRLKGQAYPDDIDFYYPAGLTSYVDSLNAKYAFSGLIVNYIWESRLAECKIPVKAIYTHDVFAYRDERMEAGADWHHHSVAEEARAVRRFRHILAIQDVERDYFRYLSPKSNVRSVYSSFSFVEQPVAANKNILFFSGAGRLNLAAIQWFIDKVFPLLLEKDADIHLLLGGNICSCLKKEDLHSNIDLMGRYDNPDEFYMLGDVCINPVCEGSGLKIKTFEAMAHGKVTVADPHSAIGIFRPEISPLIVCRYPSCYVSAIMKHLGNKEKLEAVQLHSKEYIESLNAYILRQYDDIFNG